MIDASTFRLDGRIALVTGSSAGIGLALARGLAQAGASVVLNGRDANRLAQAADSLRSEGLHVHCHGFDVLDAAAVDAAVASIEADIGAIDVLVNNAGIQRRAPFIEFTPADWQDVMRTNVDSIFTVGQAVARRMVARGRGLGRQRIINICSVMSEVGRPTTGNYAAAKGGLKMLTRAMTIEWAKHNLQVNGIGPGYFVTELTKPLVENAEFNKWICGRTPAGRWGRPEELTGAAVFLASRASDFVNGHVLYVDGGLLAAL